jgi:hypothetical protein
MTKNHAFVLVLRSIAHAKSIGMYACLPIVASALPRGTLGAKRNCMAERRRLERFDLSAPTQVIVEAESGKMAQLNLTTKDVSSGGAYLYSCQPLKKGARVTMEMLFFLDAIWKLAGEKGRVKIKVRGTVIRVDADGIAIRFESKYKITALDRVRN